MSKVVVKNIKELGEWDQVRVGFAVEGLNRILASELFRAALLAEKLTETRFEGSTHALTNQEVYDRIMKADQLHPLDELGVLDISVVLYRKSWSKVVGYTFFDSLSIWVNRKFFGGPCSIASNLLHESSHQLGFGHASTWATSVPYVMNKIVEKLWPVLCRDIDAKHDIWWNS